MEENESDEIESIPLYDDLCYDVSESELGGIPKTAPSPSGNVYNINWGELLSKYNKLMIDSIKQVHTLFGVEEEGSAWEYLPGKSETENIHLFTLKEPNAGGNNYIIKAKGLFGVRSERLIYAIKDTNPATRLAWEGPFLKSIHEHHSFMTRNGGSIRVVQLDVDLKIPMTAIRTAIGICWYGFDVVTQTYTFVFKTVLNHPVMLSLPQPPEKVSFNGLVGIIVKRLSNSECDFNMVLSIDPGGAVPVRVMEYYCNEYVRDQVKCYLKAAKEWDTYYGPGLDPKKHRN